MVYTLIYKKNSATGRDNMNKKNRLIFRTIIIIVLFAAVGYALYQNLVSGEKNQQIALNKEAPDFRLKNLENEELQLSDLKGKSVLINFWGTWCEPCKREMPAIEDAYNHYKEKGFEVILVNIRESDVVVDSFLNSNNINLPTFLDKQGAVMDAYGVGQMPSSFFIDDKGIVKIIYEGEMSREQIDTWITEVLPN